MGSRIIGALRRSIENPARPLTDEALLGLFGGELTEAGIPVSHETAYRMAAVYRAHALLAGLLGAMPLQAFLRRNVGRERGDQRLLDEPNDEKTPFEFWEFAGQSLLARGNAYVWKERDRLGRIDSIWNLHPKDVEPDRDPAFSSPINRTGKVFHFNGRRYGPDQILHIPGFSYDGIRGLSPIGLHRQGIAINLAAQRFAARMFGRGGLQPGVLMVDEELEEYQARRLQRRWAAQTAGGENQWRIPVLDSGAKYEKITLPPDEAQYLEARRFEVREIATLYGLPPHLLADVERSTSWGSGIEQQNLQLLTYTFDPWLVRVEQRITKELRPLGEPAWYARFNRRALMRADTATRYLAYQRAIGSSLQSADEARELEELEPISGGGGGIFWRPRNLAAVPGTLPPGLEEEDES